MPKAALAAVVICAVIFMIEIHEVTISLWKSKSKHHFSHYWYFIISLAV
jgi:MFS superfamily sulfate permease-like transporter